MTDEKRDRFGRLLDADGLPRCMCDTCTGKYKEPGYVERTPYRGRTVGYTEAEMKAWTEKRELHR